MDAATSSLDKSTGRARRTGSWFLKLLVSAGLVWLLLSRISIADALEKAGTLSTGAVSAALALILVQAAMAGIRWKLVVDAIGGRLALVNAVLITQVSLFFNQFLPASVGADLVRIWQSNRAGLPFATSVTSVMLERFGNLLSVVVLALTMLPLLAEHLPGRTIGGVFLLVGAGGLTALIVLMTLDRLPEHCRHARAIRALARLARDTRALFLRPRHAALLFVTAVIGQALLAAAVTVLAAGLRLEVSFVDCLLLMPPVVVVSSLPISVAGWGVRELAMVSAFGLLGVPAESALALSLILALVGTAASLPGGAIWLLMRAGWPASIRQVRR